MYTFQLNAAGYVITQICIALGGPDAVIIGAGIGNALYMSDKYCIDVMNTEKSINKIFDKSFKETANIYNIEYTYTISDNSLTGNQYCLKGDMFLKKTHLYTKSQTKKIKPGNYPTWMLLPTPSKTEEEMGR